MRRNIKTPIPNSPVRLTFWRCVIVGFPSREADASESNSDALPGNERHTDGKPQNYALPIPDSRFPMPHSLTKLLLSIQIKEHL